MIGMRTNIHSVLAPYILKLGTNEMADRVTKIVASTMLGDIRARIHQEGKASDGSDIGQYSTKPMYVSVKANPGRSMGTPFGKPNKFGKRFAKFASGKKAGQPHTSKYFEQGYLAYKNAIGRNVLGKVNLSLSGQLDNQFTLIQTPVGWGLGWFDTEKIRRANALQDRKYRKRIWGLSKEETERAKAIAENAVYSEVVGVMTKHFQDGI